MGKFTKINDDNKLVVGKEVLDRGSIEISMFIRDKDGNPTHRRSYVSDRPDEVSNFWNNNRLHKKRKKHKDQGVASATEASTVLTQLYSDIVESEEGESDSDNT